MARGSWALQKVGGLRILSKERVENGQGCSGVDGWCRALRASAQRYLGRRIGAAGARATFGLTAGGSRLRSCSTKAAARCPVAAPPGEAGIWPSGFSSMRRGGAWRRTARLRCHKRPYEG